MEDSLPLGLLGSTLASLLNHGIEPCVIGSIALVEHLPPTLWPLLATEDVDVLVWLRSSDDVGRIARAMSDLGLRRPDGRSGKWIASDDGVVAVDVVARTLPQGYAEPSCYPEPFANVAFLERIQSQVIADYLGYDGARVQVAGPLVTVLGKCLKVARYLRLDDWDTNSYRRERARRAMRCVMWTVDVNPSSFGSAAVRDLVEAADAVGSEVAKSLRFGVRSMLSLFETPSREGFRLASSHTSPFANPDADRISAAVREAATQVLASADSAEERL